MSKMPSNMRVEHLNGLARVMIGDSQRPNLFFVAVELDTQMITTDFNQAYQFWKGLSRTQKFLEPALSDRLFGVICSVEKGLNPDYPNGYTIIDCSKDFLETFCFKPKIENAA